MHSTMMITALIALAAGQAEPPRQTFNASMVTKMERGVCMAGGRTGDGTTVLFGVGVKSNAFNVEATRPSWDIVDGQDTDSDKLPITVEFADGSTTTSRYGGFDNGFTQGVWGVWHSARTDSDEASVAAFEMMRHNDSAEIFLDGKSIAKVQYGASGMAYQWIKSCLETERKAL